MKSIKKLSGAVVGVLVLGAVLTHGAPGGKKQRLDEFRVTGHVSGPEVDLGKPAGKLTVLYFWGMRCAPCMQTLPKLVKLDEAYRDRGLTVVGIHATTGDVEDIRRVCEKQKVKFPVYRSFEAPKSMAIGVLPHVLMFDGEGDLVFSGHHSQITKEVEGRFAGKPAKHEEPKSGKIKIAQ